MQATVEALGHGMMSDQRTLELMVELANLPNRRPIRGRFGHPGMSENATGKQVMTCHNYRIMTDERGTFLVHDAQLLPAARKSPAFGADVVEYIMTMAETTPAEFAESVVIRCYTAWVKADGSEIPTVEQTEEGIRRVPKPADSRYTLPVIRPTEFWYCDFVNEGALTHQGMFAVDAGAIFSGHSSQYAQELFTLVDRWRKAYRIPLEQLPTKVDQVLTEYVSSRTAKDEIMNEEELTNDVDVLAEAEAAISELSADEAPAAPGLADQVQEQGAQIERLAALLTKLSKSVVSLQRALAYQAGAPTIAPVPMMGGEEFSMSTPTPTAPPAAPAESAAKTPLQRSMEAQRRRAAKRG